MKKYIYMLLLSLLLSTQQAQAESGCYYTYKAKRDAPLSLHYGVIQLNNACTQPREASAEIARRLSSAGWTLLVVLRSVPPNELPSERATAGAYFLRY